MKKSFPELERVEKLVEAAKGKAEVQELARVKVNDLEFPIYSFILGSQDRSKPTLGLFGGVHGLEAVGSRVLTAYFESIFEQWDWDREQAQRFNDCRIVCIPIVNPGGMYLGRRSNPQGVDLMRNSPVEALDKPAWLVGGHRLTPTLPWYRGAVGQPMELEAQTLLDFVRREIFPSRASLILDLHSGFGVRDRLWYPYAKSTSAFPKLNEVQALEALLNRSLANHIYQIEPQSLNYTTHGDLWDFIFDEHYQQFGGIEAPLFLPWTLEMGSWIWVRKNPLQMFSALGVFNPVKPHRLRRVLRRHLPLLDFFLRAVKNYDYWKPPAGVLLKGP